MSNRDAPSGDAFTELFGGGRSNAGPDPTRDAVFLHFTLDRDAASELSASLAERYAANLRSGPTHATAKLVKLALDTDVVRCPGMWAVSYTGESDTAEQGDGWRPGTVMVENIDGTRDSSEVSWDELFTGTDPEHPERPDTIALVLANILAKANTLLERYPC